MDIGSVFNRALEVYKPNWVPFTLATLIFIGITAIVPQIAYAIPVVGDVLGILLQIFCSLLSLSLIGGFARMAGKANAGMGADINDLFIPLQERQVDYFMAGLLLACGSIFCGIGVLITAFLFLLGPIMVADGMGWQAAMNRAKDIAVGDPTSIVMIMLIGLGLGIASVVTCGLGYFVALPLMHVIIAVHYGDLKQQGAIA